MMISLKLLALCCLPILGLAVGCDWDTSVKEDQGLDLSSLTGGAKQLGEFREVSDPESCRAACCAEPRCDLALVGLPADGRPQCLFVSCESGGENTCVLQPSSQFKVYRKKRPAQARREEGAEKPRVVPLLGSWEPKSNETNNILCRLPMKVGPCRAAFPKFFYNVSSQSCSSFIYGGCEANGNNFDSQEECEATCSGVTGSVLPDDSTPAPPLLPAKSPRMAPAAPEESAIPQKTEMSTEEYTENCEAEPQVGPCRAAFQRWYFHKETGSCQTFIFGGCRGNKNNYIDENSCMTKCRAVTILPSSKKMDEDNTSGEKAHCLLTSDPGPCRAAFPMYYYNANAGTCQLFLYGGCRGNENRYESVEECMSSCSGDGWFDGRGKSRTRWTAAFFLFVTLAAISALLLATLVIVTLRRHRLSRRPSSISDKEELLPELDEQSSLDSLTVPESPEPQHKA
ncbi:kunitz-type protease inhibitor 2 [Parambassis ranga]|uniref:Kunitz-type protease inhibitor 2 n=1 Tax=Parambassis ranga TaxID=210632 RepID=A0A6P7JD37_9TELE|nr:tissue factor pathway inhibitor-like [Parambassis ranga]